MSSYLRASYPRSESWLFPPQQNKVGRSLKTVTMPASETVHALYNRGNALRVLGRLGEAVASYDRMLALEPHHAGVHNAIRAR